MRLEGKRALVTGGAKGIGEAIPSIKIGLEWDTPRLYERINRRVDLMMEQGLVAEVEGLLKQGFREGLTAPAAIGYKEVVAALHGEETVAQAAEEVKKSSRHYAKRQLTWLRRNPKLHWLNRQTGQKNEEILSIARQIIYDSDS